MNTQELVDKIARTPLSQVLMFAIVLSIFRVLSYGFLRNTPAHLRSGSWKVVSGIGEIFDSLIYAAIFIFMVIRPYFFQAFQIPSGSLFPTCKVGDFIGLNKAIYRYTEPKRGDIVVFRPPADACTPKQLDADGTVNTDFVKRLIGLPGDLVEIHSGAVYINNRPLWEPYKHYTTPTNPDFTDFKLLEGSDEESIMKASWKLIEYKGELVPLNYTEFDANRPGASYPVAKRYEISDPTEWPKVRALPAQKLPPGYFLFMGDNRNGSFDGRGWGLIHRSAIIGRAEFIWLPLNRLGKVGYVDNGQKQPPGAEVDEFLKK